MEERRRSGRGAAEERKQSGRGAAEERRGSGGGAKEEWRRSEPHKRHNLTLFRGGDEGGVERGN